MQRATLEVPGAGSGGRWPPNAPAPSSPGHALRGLYDPRASSTHSLVPSMDGTADSRRRLLIIYIHGFMGNNSSFRSFPAHVHNFLRDLLAETHVVHTKIYPRYKTYKSIDVARDNFSAWLAPHESDTTDVVLVGHSMGGLLAADVVLLPSQNPNASSSPFRHRILGTVSLDAPLLGLHPGIVVSGIASLFRPAPSPAGADGDTQTEDAEPGPSRTLSPDPSTYAELSPPPGTRSPILKPSPSGSTMNSPSPDPYYNPSFFNDVSFVDRGWTKNIAHFVRKHKDENLIYAAANHILSHLEFGGCLADYPTLRARYERLRRLEDVDEWYQPGVGQKLVRVRFVNYYTVSTGAIKRSRPGSPHGFSSHADGQRDSTRTSLDIDSRVSTPRISIEDCAGRRPESLQVLEPMPESFEPPAAARPPKEDIPVAASRAGSSPSTEPATDQDLLPRLPTIPDLPSPPVAPDLDSYPDKESRKHAETAFKQELKAYKQAVKHREKAIKARQKALDKEHRKAAKDAAKREKDARSNSSNKLHKSPAASSCPEEDDEFQAEELRGGVLGLGLGRGEAEQDDQQQQQRTTGKRRRRRKFCMLPSGRPDPAWVEVYMEGVDEVGAHCGLFLPGAPHYERLVGDVGERIALWVWEDASRRAIIDGL